jgi:hypothetical protein
MTMAQCVHDSTIVYEEMAQACANANNMAMDK